MLVLTRKPNQQIRIGNDIVVTVVKVRGNTIRLGIEAPQDVRVMRSELEPKAEGNATLVVESMTVTFDAIDAGEAADDEPAGDKSPIAPAADSKSMTLKYPGYQAAPPAKNSTSSGKAQFGSNKFGLPSDKVEDSPLCHRPLADRVRSVQSKAKPSIPADKKLVDTKSSELKIPGVA